MPSCEIWGFHSGFAEYSGLLSVLRLYAEPTGKLTSLHIPEDLDVHNATMLSGICEACLLSQVQDWFLFLLSVPAPRAESCVWRKSVSHIGVHFFSVGAC
jgi:hypothetical protein